VCEREVVGGEIDFWKCTFAPQTTTREKSLCILDVFVVAAQCTNEIFRHPFQPGMLPRVDFASKFSSLLHPTDAAHLAYRGRHPSEMALRSVAAHGYPHPQHAHLGAYSAAETAAAHAAFQQRVQEQSRQFLLQMRAAQGAAIAAAAVGSAPAGRPAEAPTSLGMALPATATARRAPSTAGIKRRHGNTKAHLSGEDIRRLREAQKRKEAAAKAATAAGTPAGGTVPGNVSASSECGGKKDETTEMP